MGGLREKGKGGIMPLTLSRKGSLRRRNKIAELKAAGWTNTQIASKVGVAMGTVTYYLRTSAPAPKASKGENRVKRPYHRHFSPIVIGSTSTTNGRGVSGGLNDTSLLDLLWARLTVEEKVQAIGAIKRMEADNG